MAAARNFRISRAPSASRDAAAAAAAASHDPFAKLVFEPALESDELFDALREAYPAVKTHTERKKQAVLDFLMNERQAIEQEITAFVHGTTAPAPAPAPAPAATMPADFSVQDNTCAQSYVSPAPSVPRKSSCSEDESFTSSSAAPSSAGSSPETLSLKQMTSVWTASGDAPPKIHHRRSMTTREKEEYRRRRQMKACQDCRSRKRKCNHNTTAAASSGVSSSKVKKRSQQQQQTQQSHPHPHHATPSDSSFQLDGSSVWGESSLMGSVMESPLNFTDFGPTASSGAVEGFDDFLLLPDEDELSMAFSPDPLFSTNNNTPMTTAAMQPNNAFPYAYVDPFLPTQTYDYSLGSSSSTSASAFSSPGRSMANSNANSNANPAVIAPAQMHQSPQNWDMDLAGIGVNVDFTGHEHLLHGHTPMPTTHGCDGDGLGVVNNASLHRVNQPQASRNNARSASSSTTSNSATAAASSSSGRGLLHSGGAQPSLAIVQQQSQTHACDGVGTPVSTSAISTRASAASHGDPTLTWVTADADTTNSSPLAPAPGPVCYVPQSRTRRRAAARSDVQDSSASARGCDGEALAASTRDASRSTARVLDGYGRGAVSRPLSTQNASSPVVVSARTSASASASAFAASSAAGSHFGVEGTLNIDNTASAGMTRGNRTDETSRTSCTTIAASRPASMASAPINKLLSSSPSPATLFSLLILAASSTFTLDTALGLTSPWPLALSSSLVLAASLLCLYAYLSAAPASAAWPPSTNTVARATASAPVRSRISLSSIHSRHGSVARSPLPRAGRALSCAVAALRVGVLLV